MAAVLLPAAAGAQADDVVRVVVLPDTQIYAQSDAGAATMQAQASWIAANAAATNTVFVTHVGDVVQNPNSETEWDRVEPAFEMLEAAGLPYGIAAGNHDMVDTSVAIIDERFGPGRFTEPWFLGHHRTEGTRGSHQEVVIDGHRLLFVHLRHLVATYGDVAQMLDYLDDVLAAHPDHLAFVTTHEFTDPNGSVAIAALEQRLVNHCNVTMVFSGHREGESQAGTFVDACGRTVHHVLTNYQFLPGGGEGYLRTIDIERFSLQASMQVYSPTLDDFRTGPTEAVALDLAPLPLVAGDTTCDRVVNVLDALFIVQHEVGLRGDVSTSCPLRVPASQIVTASADVTGDGVLNVIDALFITQCNVGVSNRFCPPA